MNNPVIIKSYTAEAALTKYRLVKFGATDDVVTPATAVADKILGVLTDVDALINQRADVVVEGITDVEYGGTVTRGDPLTTDASGRAVTAAPAAGVNNRIIGIAMVSGVISDVGSVKIAQSLMQG